MTVEGVPAVVFIVDDDISVRESLSALIEVAGWTSVEFETAGAFLRYPRPEGPSCLVLDVNLPDLSGLDVQTRIASDRDDMPIIFITGYSDVPMSVKAMKAGAAEFLPKPFNDTVLIEAVARALEYSASFLKRDATTQRIKEAYTLLTPRERDVMALVVSGLLNKQVGAELGISEITVKAHRGRVMRKMGATSFVSLINMAALLQA